MTRLFFIASIGASAIFFFGALVAGLARWV